MLKNKNDIVISIIIVSYNNFDILKRCLKSIYKYLTTIDFEIIVVDNNSVENGLDETIDGYPNIVVIQNKENKGFAKANNQGVNIAQGENILLLNNDTEFLDDPISEILTYVKDSIKPIIGAAKLLNIDMTYQPSAYKFPTIWRLFSSNFFFEKLFKRTPLFNKYYLDIENEKSPQIVNSVIGAFMLMKKKTYKELGGFDESFFFYHEDTDLCYRLANFGGETIYFPHLSLIHVGGGSTKHIKWFQLKNKVIARFKFFYKHHTFPYYVIALALEYSGNLVRAMIYILLGILTFKKENFESALYFLKTLSLSRKSL